MPFSDGCREASKVGFLADWGCFYHFLSSCQGFWFWFFFFFSSFSSTHIPQSDFLFLFLTSLHTRALLHSFSALPGGVMVREGATQLVTQQSGGCWGWWEAKGSFSTEPLLKLVLINLIVNVRGRGGGSRPQSNTVGLMERQVIKYNLTACCEASLWEIRKLSSKKTMKLICN